MTASGRVARPRRGVRWGMVLAVVVVLGVIAYLALAGIGNALVFYLTPTELLARGEAAHGETVRLGGLVQQDSLRGSAEDVTFIVTDGESEITVHSTDAPTALFREGVGVVVEGALDADGVFQATQILVKHDENYEAPPSGEVPDDRLYVPPDEDGAGDGAGDGASDGEE